MQQYIEQAVEHFWKLSELTKFDDEALEGLVHAIYHGGPEYEAQHRLIWLVCLATRSEWPIVTYALEDMLARRRGGRCISILACLN